MRINKIASSGTLAIRNVEIRTESQITLICGANRAGKSSLRNGIYHAFTGENPCEPLKKNYPLLINRADGNNVGYTYVDYNNGQKACITLPNGTHELTEEQHYAMPFLLNPSLFASITTDERRRFLFDLGNLRSDGAEVKGKLIERGCDAGKIEMILPFLKSSFDNAQKHADEKAKEARASWKTVTGEAYGSLKAGNWQATIPYVDKNAMSDCEKYISDIESQIESSNQKLGSLQSEFSNANKNSAEINNLRSMAEKIERIENKLAIDRKELAMWTVKVEDAKFAAMGSSPGCIAVKCPECAAELTFTGKELVARGGDLHGDEEIAAKLPDYEKTLAMLKKAVASGERDLASAKYAKDRLAELEKEQAEVISEERINQLKEKISGLKLSRKKAQEDLDKLTATSRQAGEAESKTKKAAAHHAEVLQWEKISEALAPEGIPSEMLSAALNPVNARISASVKALGFPGKVRIQDDMTIMEDDGKLYSFSSKATKLLIDSMIAEAISYVSGIKFFMVDEVDLLDLPSRSAYLGWLIDIAEKKEIDSVLLFATLKAMPAGLPPTIQANWIEGGMAHDRKVEAA